MDDMARDGVAGAGDLGEAWFDLELERIAATDPVLAHEIMRRQDDLEKKIIAASAEAQTMSEPEEFVAPDRAESGPEVIIIGAGVGGLSMGAGLKRAGFKNFKILEKAKGIGGTWYHNRYPGVACDVNSYLYQFSFRKNYDWSGSFPSGPEIRTYLEDFADHFGLLDHIQFETHVDSCVYRSGRWHVNLSDGSVIEGDVLISACGFLHVPNVPSIKGLEDFGGVCMHSAEWDSTYDFKGKRVGLIGNGSSSVQIAPNLIDDVSSLTLFQRTAQWIFPAPKNQYSEQRVEMLRQRPDLVDRLYDFYMAWYADGFGRAVAGDDEAKQFFIEACEQNLASIEDEGLREKLTPPDPVMCKRLIFGDGFYQALQRDHADVVVEAIEQVEEGGIRTADGKLHELDALIMATGFHTHVYCRNLNVSVEGGPSLNDVWSSGAETMDTIMVAGFPNFFILGGPYTTIGNLSTMTCSEVQTDYIMQIIEEAVSRSAPAVEAVPEAQQDFVDEMQAHAQNTVWVRGCSNWYLDEHGKVDIWPRTPRHFLDFMKAGPNLDHYEFKEHAAAG
ncbi:flavin-containing monooxygenase [Croceicoccus sediminis]|uniref:flavin-containing monooxygenase n=1 Tax=Croceicoccus sediminis TaxID=2571150 RepID=UPI0011837FA2|nr:NAD(P)/FAD-dependent oxidoreductase [Croceicoccus sediminis]